MNGLDFFKSCATNTRAIENIFDTPFVLYKSTQGWGEENKIQAAVKDLREQNILCASSKEELYIFGPLDGGQAFNIDANEYGLREYDGWSNFESDKKTANGKLLIDALLEAVEGAISYSLSRGYWIVHMGYFTWLFLASGSGNGEDEGTNILVKLNVNLTENGALYISTTTAPSDLRPLDEPSNRLDATINLAPSGRKAKLAVDSDGDGMVLTAPSTAINATNGWMPSVYNALSAEGINMDIEHDWVVVELLDGKGSNRFLWPQRFCFVDGKRNQSTGKASADENWQQWFAGSEDAFKDPLAEAEEWIAGAAERERLSKASTENGAIAADGTAFSSNMVADTPLATSPPFNQRLMDQQAALSGIYPTPPDGLLPANATQLPTSDGASGPMQTEQSGLGNELQLTSSDDNQLGQVSSGSNADAQGYNPNDDDLFGDVEEMDFGANEVGDADFDYFDEPDELPQAPSADPDVEMAENLSSPHEKEDTTRKPSVDIFNEPDEIALEQATVPDSQPTSNQEPPVDPPAPGPSHDIQTEPKPVESSEPSPALTVKEPEKPLSPWGIRRQLLPMIPASAVSAESTSSQSSRRNSTFEPIAFNENLDLVWKYAASKQVDFAPDTKSNVPATPSIALPQKRKKYKAKSGHDPDSGVTDLGSSSEDDDDSYESDNSMSEDEAMPPRLPWDTKKRKRASWQEQTTPTTAAGDGMWPMDDVGDSTSGETNNMTDILDSLLHTRANVPLEPTIAPSQVENDDLPTIESLFELSKQDLIYIAQILAEQATSSVPSILASLNDLSTPANAHSTSLTLEAVIETLTETVLPNASECNIQQLAGVREPPRPPMLNPGKALQGQIGPPGRMLQREGSIQLGPDYFTLPPPFIRVMRGTENWEMLPPALNFWSALGLGPAGGSKDVAPVAVAPGNSDLGGLAGDFVKDLGGVYESWKLGSFGRTAEFDKALEGVDGYEEGRVLVEAPFDEMGVSNVLRAFGYSCEELGKNLAAVGHLEPDRTIVVFLLDPFEDARLKPYLAAAFWKLCKAYRQHVPKAHVKAARSDIQLQLLPVSLIASPDKLIVLDSQHFGSLATQVYDSCPPSSKTATTMDTAAALPILAAPAVELAAQPPRRIAFQLTADPPADLMNEGSILHLAYAMSEDREWMAVCWIDSTGRYQQTLSTPLHGRSFSEVAGEVWERTLAILTAREVTWRVFVVKEGVLGMSEARCWRALAVSRPRRQVLHVTFLTVEMETSLQLSPPSGVESVNGGGHGQFLTPGSTPQATSMTVSPDASGQTAPPTPAPTDPPPNPENDPDAHLVDVTDESWAVILASSFTSTSTCTNTKTYPPIAKGILFRRGDQTSSLSSHKLESMGVNVLWDLRIRPQGLVEEGPGKQGEATLREVLRLYRGLGLLGRARNGVSMGESLGDGMLPIHVGSVRRAAEALSHFKV